MPLPTAGASENGAKLKKRNLEVPQVGLSAVVGQGRGNKTINHKL